jgi:transketolase
MVAEQTKPVELESIANEVRQLVLKVVHKVGAGHIGGPLSVADLMAALYFDILRIDPLRPSWEDRDRFILSKGHSCLAQYSAMALRGYFPVDELYTFDAIDSRLQGHPDMKCLPGLDMSSGSLGQGLSPAVGMALGAKLLGKGFHTWVVLGDGEIQEGQVWEGAFIAERYGLDNLTAIVDYNKLQQYGWTWELHGSTREAGLSIADPAAKFAAWGWETQEIDGHDMSEIRAACRRARLVKGRPCAIIAHTIKGKGVSFIEGQFAWHARSLNETELTRALAELQANQSD